VALGSANRDLPCQHRTGTNGLIRGPRSHRLFLLHNFDKSLGNPEVVQTAFSQLVPVPLRVGLIEPT
jgi:hypothetical protein